VLSRVGKTTLTKELLKNLPGPLPKSETNFNKKTAGKIPAVFHDAMRV
jgi:hypothetical protein